MMKFKLVIAWLSSIWYYIKNSIEFKNIIKILKYNLYYLIIKYSCLSSEVKWSEVKD
jgi:hypothetical protein